MSLENDFATARKVLEDAWLEYLKVCARGGIRPPGAFCKIIAIPDLIELGVRIIDAQEHGNSWGGDGSLLVTLPRALIEHFLQEDGQNTPPALSLFCTTCGGNGRVCSICHQPEDASHTHTVGSSKVPIRVWDHCPICVIPFLVPPPKDPSPELPTPPPSSPPGS